MKLIFPAYLRKIAVDSRSKRLHHAPLENIRFKCANNMNDIAIIFSQKLGCLVIVTFFIFAYGYLDLYIFAFTGKKNPNIFKPFNRIRINCSDFHSTSIHFTQSHAVNQQQMNHVLFSKMEMV